jgi:D-alanyl-D-alanine carboxypeptidase (penicillin-binding protein 5/6)
MKRFLRSMSLVIVIALIIVAGGYTWHKTSAVAPSIKPVRTTKISYPGSLVKLPWPSYGQAAIGAEGYGVLETHNTTKSLPTASTAKVMTALCVLAKHPLELGQSGPTLTLTQNDVNLFNEYYAKDGSLVKVAVGEKITEYQALEAMLLPSANNMADTLAIWAFGSLSAYTSYANNYARQLGLKNTHFAVDASGFDPHTVSTASDLVLLGQAAMENPVVAQIVGKKTAKVPVAGKIANVNHMLGRDGIIGIKTGDNDQDMGVYMFAAKHEVSSTQSVVIIGAIMGGPSVVRAELDSLKLLVASQHGFEERQLIAAGETIGRYSVPWGNNVAAVAQQNLSVLAWKGTPITADVQLNDITPPVKANQVVGTISVKTSERTITNDPVIINHAIATPRLKWRLLHP